MKIIMAKTRVLSWKVKASVELAKNCPETIHVAIRTMFL